MSHTEMIFTQLRAGLSKEYFTDKEIRDSIKEHKGKILETHQALLQAAERRLQQQCVEVVKREFPDVDDLVIKIELGRANFSIIPAMKAIQEMKLSGKTVSTVESMLSAQTPQPVEPPASQTNLD